MDTDDAGDIAVDTDDAGDIAVDTDAGDTDVGCPSYPYPTLPGIVPTDEGAFTGERDDGVIRWLGIPYAAPPIGELRFRPPAPPLCRGGVFSSVSGPRCPQLDGDTVVGDEDCLTLDIWVPDAAQPVPTLVFFHGGGHIQGSARETVPGGGFLYDGQHLARAHGVAVVTVQYRLGALGWLAHPALAEEAPTAGNRGLLDQQAALRWLHKNLARFGGDPSKITIFGESAGAVDTSLHLALPSSAGLFDSAIIQSGSPAARPLATALAEGQDLVADSPCAAAADVARCLRELDIVALVTAMPGAIGIGSPGLGAGRGTYGPVVDGVLLPGAPLELLATPRADRPSVIVGSNAEEMANLLGLQIQTEAAYIDALRLGIAAPIALASGRSTDEVLDTILTTYPVSAYDSPQAALEDVYTDLRFTCPAVELLTALSVGGHEVRRYVFSRRTETANGVAPASHGRELVYVFGSWRNIPRYQPAAADKTLSDQMMAAWASTGGEVPGLESWPLWETNAGATVVFDAPLSVATEPREDRCAMWRSLASP